jgi:hypothetical protein
MKHFITYDGTDYEIKEPTVALWMDLTALEDFTDNIDFSINIISMATGLDKEQIKELNWYDIMNVAQSLSEYFLNQSQKFYDSFEFKGVKYRFIDLANLTFGEFVDIDTFLTKPPHQRKRELHYHMALLYREVDKEGNIVKYDSSLLQARADLFKELPVKYVNGALNFFFLLELELRKHSGDYLKRLIMAKTITMRVMMANLLLSFGIGISRLQNWLITTSQKCLRFFKSLLRLS